MNSLASTSIRLSLAVVTVALLLAVLAMGGPAAHASTPPANMYFVFLANGVTDCGPAMPPAPPTPMGAPTIAVSQPPPETLRACVWAKGVKTGIGGAAGFNLDFRYDNDFVQATSFTSNTTWLSSTGRSVSCGTPLIEAIPNDPNGLWRLFAACYSFAQTPLGPTGWGLLGMVTFHFGNPHAYGFSDLIHTNTFLTRVTSAIPPTFTTTANNGKILYAHCADFSIAGNPPDGAVSVADIVELVKHFGQTPASPGWNSTFDLDGNSSISVSDILIAVQQFGMVCYVAP